MRTHDSGKSAPDYSIIVNPFLCIYSNCRRNACLFYCLYRDYSTKKRGYPNTSCNLCPCQLCCPPHPTRSILEGLLSAVHRWLLEVNSGHSRKHLHEGQLPAKMDFDADDAYEAVVSSFARPLARNS